MSGKHMRMFVAVGFTTFVVLLMNVGNVSFNFDPKFEFANETADAAEGMSAEEFDRRVPDYLMRNPEIVVEAQRLFEERQRATAVNTARVVLKERAQELFSDAASPVGGNPKGDVTLVEFFDYNCPYCRRVAPTMNKLVADDPRLRLAYKEFPILGPNSVFAAKAALAARRQNKYVAFHNALMTHKGTVDEKAALAAAAKVGIDVGRLRKDMKAPETAAAIVKNVRLAQALGIDGTPAFVIGDQIIRGAIDLNALKAAIQRARQSREVKQN